MTTNQRIVGSVMVLCGLVVLATALLWKPDTGPIKRHVDGDVWTYEENGWIVYEYRDTQTECRYRITEWQRPVCGEME